MMFGPRLAKTKHILSLGAAMRSWGGDNLAETPDIIVGLELGVIYTSPTNRTIAEHGGFSIGDRHVPILIANPRFEPNVVRTPVQAGQLASTIVKLLGLDTEGLEGVRVDKTEVLPGLFLLTG